MSYIHNPVLILNKSWLAMMVKPATDAICDACDGKVRIVDPRDWQTYSLKEWMELDVTTDDKLVRTSRCAFRVPEIVIHTEYNDVPDLELKWGRRNLALRDNNECQYCGCKVHGDDLTIDHVIPKTRGGKNTWANTVVSCKPCNRRKANRTPEEARMPLRRKPFKPKWYPVTSKYATKMPHSWVKFIPGYKDHPLGDHHVDSKVS